MAYMEKCKGCTTNVNVSLEEIKVMILNVINSGNFNLVSEEVYKKRLQKCENCKYMEFDTTCRQCGCIVQIRALFAEKDCPYPKKSMWK
jgi:hypothetical protein